MAIVLETFSCRVYFLPLFKNQCGQKVSKCHVTWFALQGKLSFAICTSPAPNYQEMPSWLLIISKDRGNSCRPMETDTHGLENFFVQQNKISWPVPPLNFSLKQGCVWHLHRSHLHAWRRRAHIIRNSVPMSGLTRFSERTFKCQLGWFTLHVNNKNSKVQQVNKTY